MAQTIQHLNLALRRGIWKTCQSLAWESLANEQMETVLDSRWQVQGEAVSAHLNNELSSFFYYSYRQISNEELAQFSQLHQTLQPWVEAMGTTIDQYFVQLRQRLVLEPLTTPKRSEVDGPFPASRPLRPALSQSQPQP